MAMAAESMEFDDGGSSTARAGGGSLQPNWRPLQSDLLVDYTCGSTTTSGTTLSSSTYTHTSGGSHLSFDQVGGSRSLLDVSWQDKEERARTLEHIKGLIGEFSSSANGDVSVLEMWFSEMDVGWVLNLADHASSVTLLQLGHFSGRWIRALNEMTESLRHTYDSLCFDFLNLFAAPEDGPVRDQVLLARFAESSILKMLPFVDAIVAQNLNTSSAEVVIGNKAPAPAEKLQALIHVREALSKASQDFRLSFCSTTSEEAKRVMDEMFSLLLSKEGKLDEAIWNTMEQVRARLLEFTVDDDSSSWGTQTPPQVSPGIHTVTRAIISYIKVQLMPTNCAILHQIVDKAAQRRSYVPKIRDMSPLTSMIMEMVSCLEQTLAKRSQSFPDHSLRFLFLINNSYFIWRQLSPTSVLEFHMTVLTHKIDNYTETYLQLSWAPVLSCLYSSTHLLLGRYSSLAKFESEFQKTYNTQKLWKVPDPELRTRLRQAIIERVISGFAKYLEYSNITSTGVNPQELEEMLQELFEG